MFPYFLSLDHRLGSELEEREEFSKNYEASNILESIINLFCFYSLETNRSVRPRREFTLVKCAIEFCSIIFIIIFCEL